MYRKFDPISLYGVEYQSGTMFFPDKIKINYRYFPGATTTARLYVMGVLPGETIPKPLCVSYELPISECPRERIMTSVVELKYDTNATEIFLLISNYEYLQDLYSIIGVFEKGEIKYGEVATVESFNCNALDIPVANAATDIMQFSFYANWNKVVNGIKYLLDVSEDIDFETFLEGYESKDVGDNNIYLVTGLTESTCYFYRIRAANSDGFITLYSNTIHVPYATSYWGHGKYILSVTKGSKGTITFESDCIVMSVSGSDSTGVYINTWYANTLPWSNNFRVEYDIKKDGVQPMDDYAFRTVAADSDTFICNSLNTKDIKVRYDLGGVLSNFTFLDMLLLDNTWEHVSVTFEDGLLTVTTDQKTETGTYTPTNPATIQTNIKWCAIARAVAVSATSRYKNMCLYFQVDGSWVLYTNIKGDDWNYNLLYSPTVFIKDHRNN